MNQQTGLRLPSFFITEPAPCPYLEGQMERKLFTHLAGSDAVTLNNTLTHAGFRRSQSIAYRPACDACSACKSVRVVLNDFTPSTSFRRLMRKNADLTGEVCPPRTGREQYDLLRRYLDARHENGGMADMTPGDYVAMVEETAVDTFVTEYRAADGVLLACLLGDRMQDGISLVYSFFDPGAEKRSLGSFMILDQIASAKEAGHAHIYLGYLIEDCRKMAYKKRFAPLQRLEQDGWEDYHPG